HPLPDLSGLRLLPTRGRGAVRVAVGVQLPMHLRMRCIKPALLDRELQQHGAHLRNERVGLVDAVDPARIWHGRSMVAGPSRWPASARIGAASAAGLL